MSESIHETYEGRISSTGKKHAIDFHTGLIPGISWTFDFTTQLDDINLTSDHVEIAILAPDQLKEGQSEAQLEVSGNEKFHMSFYRGDCLWARVSATDVPISGYTYGQKVQVTITTYVPGPPDTA